MNEKRNKPSKKPKAPKGLANSDSSIGETPINNFVEQNPKHSENYGVGEKRKQIPRGCRILQKVLSCRSPRGKPYYKHRIVISIHLLRLLGWKAGMPIKQEIVGDSILMTPVKPDVYPRGLP